MRYRVLYPDSQYPLSAFAIDEALLEHTVYVQEAEGDVNLEDPDEALERLFEVYNIDEERPHPIRSMSVGDVVVLDDLTSWICLATGWAPAIVTHAADGFRVELLAAELA